MTMMNAPDDRIVPAVPRTAEADDPLVRALRDAAPRPDDADLPALQVRVMADWRQRVDRAARHRRRAAAPAPGGVGRTKAAAGLPSGTTGRGGAGWRRPAAVGVLGLALLLAWTGWQRQREAALEELMQPDVLSQMAAGEL
jgi:hypothetical protein